MAQSEQRHGAIRVQGARTHNLAGVTVSLPKHRLTVVTGVSGSGKSSLVLDTIAAEANRLVTSTYPVFVRTRLPQFPPADVDRVDGLTFTSVVDQRPFQGGARSTVGTASDIAPMIRMLFARAGHPAAGYSPAYSFNDPSGMCPRCEGLGYQDELDLDELVDGSRTLRQGPIRFVAFAPGSYRWKRLMLSGLADPDTPWACLPQESVDTLLHATGLALSDPSPGYPQHALFDGVVPRIRKSYLRTSPSRLTRQEQADLHRIITRRRCPGCAGTRLNAAARNSLVQGRSITDWTGCSVRELDRVVHEVRDADVAPLVSQISCRLRSLDRVGLGYLTLDRGSDTLSGGEAQRVKIVRNLDSALSDVTYVFDEPTSGLHPHDIHRLLAILTDLRDAGNTVVVMEHHPVVIGAADHIIDLGPGGGAGGGTVQFEGSPTRLAETDVVTGRMLRDGIRLRARPRVPTEHVTIADAHSHNLRGITVDIPLHVLTVVTGVAGSGKSSLVADELPHQHPRFTVLAQRRLHGGARSTPATVLDIGDPLRAALSARSGLDRSWFTANGKGACPTCKGRGYVVTDLAFLDDVRTPCEACRGTRFHPRSLETLIGGRNIAELLSMTPGEAMVALADDVHTAPALPRLSWMIRTGLDYLSIGQTLDTLSGGERQRLLLARHLADHDRGDATALSLVLDEPTRGLHGHDVARLLALCDELADAGATLVLVEHNQAVIAAADHVIDLGPGAGSDGGRVVFEGPPSGLVRCGESVTGRMLGAAL